MVVLDFNILQFPSRKTGLSAKGKQIGTEERRTLSSHQLRILHSVFSYLHCFKIHFRWPYSVSSVVQCSLMGVMSGSLGQVITL